MPAKRKPVVVSDSVVTLASAVLTLRRQVSEDVQADLGYEGEQLEERLVGDLKGVDKRLEAVEGALFNQLMQRVASIEEKLGILEQHAGATAALVLAKVGRPKLRPGWTVFWGDSQEKNL